jgi:hypothetical protein
VSGDDDGSWHDQQPVIVAAGVAGVVLLALLLWAVIHTANKSSRPPEPVEFAPSSGHVVDVYDEVDVEHELHDVECPNQPGQSGRDWAAGVDTRRRAR